MAIVNINISAYTAPEADCKTFIGFTYKGTGDFVLQYMLCGDTVYTQHTFVNLPGNGGADAYYDMDIDMDFPGGICVVNNSVSKISGGSEIVFSSNYGLTSCSEVISSNYRIEDCETGFSYNCAKGSSDFAIGDVIEFIPIADDTLIRCGMVSSVTYHNSNPDCTITGLSRSGCGDTVHCGVANPNSGLT